LRRGQPPVLRARPEREPCAAVARLQRPPALSAAAATVGAAMTDQMIPASELPTAGFPDCLGCAYFCTGPARLCLACASPRLLPPGPDSCPECAQRLRADGACPNERCRSSRRRIGKIHALGYQAGPLRRPINSYKYRGSRSLAVVLGRLLLAWLERHMAADPPGLIVVNPSFVAPAGQQFAHAEAVLTAAAQADADNRWPFDPAAIIKTRPTLKSAHGQAWSKRVSGNELRDALLVPDPARTAGEFVLVCDDVCTTGSQLDAVAGCLLDQGGAARLEAVVLARALWRDQLGALSRNN
jgi:predicted amidophosphoribosyltransferase